MLSEEAKILLLLCVALGLTAGFHMICFYQCITAKVCALGHGYNFEGFLCWKLPWLANGAFSVRFSGNPAKMDVERSNGEWGGVSFYLSNTVVVSLQHCALSTVCWSWLLWEFWKSFVHCTVWLTKRFSVLAWPSFNFKKNSIKVQPHSKGWI